MQPACVLKLGGSLVTHKLSEDRFREDLTTAIARVLAATNVPLVLVHGTGSYGKPPARRFGYLDGRIRAGCAGIVPFVQGRLEELRCQVLRALRDGGVPAVGLSTCSLVRLCSGLVSSLAAGPIEAILARGLVPVLAGDLVVDDEGGFSVCSSDILASALAVHLRASRLIVASDVPGVLRADGSVVAEIDGGGGLSEAAVVDMPDDVSGGMAGKVEAALLAARTGIDTMIIDGRRPSLVSKALRGEAVPGTRIVVKSPALCAD